jgi:hypothetical protein
MASSKILLKDQQRKDGTYPITIRIINGRKVKYTSTGYSVKQTQFKEGMEGWVIKHPDAMLINAAIEAKRKRIMEAYYRADIEGIDQSQVNIRGTFFRLL